MSKPQQKPPIVLERDEYDALMKDPLSAWRLKIGIEIGRFIVKDSGTTETPQRSSVEKKSEHADEDTVTLEITVPRGWREFLYAYPRWHAHNPRIGDSLDEELREMVRAEIVMLIDEIWTSRPDISAELVKKYSLQDIDPSKRR